MSENSIDPMTEIQEIIEEVLNKPLITKDDCAEAQAKFQMTFLTLPNKEQFIKFLTEYLSTLVTDLGSDDDKCNSVKMEIERFYDNIPSIFSLYRIAGLKDPHDKNDSEVMSKDIDSDFEDIMKQKGLGDNDLVIPEDKKTAIARVFQNISIFADQIKANRIQTLTKWRFLRLVKKNSEILKIVPALFTIEKFARRKYRVFNLLREATQPPKKNGVSDQSLKAMPSIHDSQSVKAKSEQNAFNDQTTKEDRNKTQRESSSMASVGYENELSDLRNQLKNRDEVIRNLREELKKISSQSVLTSTVNSNGLDDQIKQFKNQIIDLESKVMELTKDNESKKNMITSNIAQLLDSKNQILKLTSEVKALQLENSKVNLSRFGKVRFFSKVMRSLNLKLTHNAFNKMLKKSVRAADAIREVGLRMKARLLDQTRSLNCGNDIHRSFLKWFVRSDNDFLRNAMTKVLVNCKISHVIAVYRLKKLIAKPRRLKLSDGIKMLHKSKGSMILHELFNKKGADFKKLFMHNINPNNKSKNEVLLEKLMMSIPKTHFKNAKKVVLDTLTGILHKEKQVLENIKNYWHINKLVALDRLKRHNWEQKNIGRLSKFEKGFSIIQKLVMKRQREFIDKIKQKTGEKFLKVLNRLISAVRGKQTAAINQLKLGLISSHLEKTKHSMQSSMADMRKSHFFNKLISASKQKCEEALDSLKSHSLFEKQKQNRILQLQKRILNNFVERLKGVKAQTLKKLRNNRLKEINKEAKKLFTCELIMDCQHQKMMACLAGLTQNYAESKGREIRKNRLLETIFSKLNERSKLKCSKALKRLVNNNKLLKSKLLGDQSRILNRLSNLRNSLTSTALRKLIANSSLKKSQQNSEDHKKRMLAKIMGWYKLPLFKVLRDLRKFAANSKRNKQLEQEKMTSLFKKITQKSAIKAESALGVFKDTFANDKNEKDKRNRLIAKMLRELKIKTFVKVRSALEKLQHNNSKLKNQDLKNKGLLNRLLGDLAYKQSQKQLNCVNRLRDLNRVLGHKNHQKNVSLRNLFNRLVRASNGKKERAMTTLLVIRTNDRMNQQVDRIKSKFDQALLKRKQKGLLMLLVSSQMGKMAAVLAKLAKHSNIKRIDELRQKERIRNRLQKLTDCLKAKMNQALEHLKDNKNSSVQQDKIKQNKMDKLKDILGLPLRDLNAEKFAELAKQLKTAKKPSKDINLRRLKDWMKNRNKRGVYDEILNAIESGKIKGLKDALEWLKSNNQNNQMLPVINRINDFNREAHDVLESTKQTNQDGSFGPFINEVERAPKQPKTDIADSIIRNKDSKAFRGLKEIVDENRKIDDLIRFMRFNNKDGKYDKALDYLRALPCPKLTDLIHLIAADKHNDYEDLKRQVNNEDSVLTPTQLTEIARNCKKPDLYKPMIDFVEKERFVSLIDIYKFMKLNNKDSIYSDFIDVINDKKQFNQLKSSLTGKTEIQPGSDKIDHLAKMIDWMNANNEDGLYNETLDHLFSLDNPKLFDLVTFANLSSEESERFDDLLDKLDRDIDKKRLKNMVFKNPLNFGDLVSFWDSDSRLTLGDIVHIIGEYNKDGAYDPVVEMINGDENSKTAATVLNYLKQNNKNGRYDELTDKLSNKANIPMNEVVKIISADNSDFKYDEVLGFINNKNPPRINEAIRHMKLNNRNDRFKKLLSFVEKKPDLLVTDLIDELEKDNKNGELNDLQTVLNNQHKRNLRDNVIEVAVRSNINGKYNDILKDLRDGKNSDLSSMVGLIKRKNNNGSLDELISVVNESPKDQLMIDIQDFIKDNNQDGRYTELINMLRNKKNPKLTDVVEWSVRNNQDGQMEPLMEFINGNNFSIQRIRDFMTRQNKDGRFNDLISFANQNPTANFEKFIETAKVKETPGQMDGLFSFLNNGLYDIDPDEGNDDLFKFLAHARRQQEHPELIKFLENGKVRNPQQLLDYLTKNNKDGQYDDVINRVLKHIDQQSDVIDSKASKGPSLTKASKGKLIDCLSKLQNLNKEGKLRNLIKNTKILQLFNLLKAKQDAKKMASLIQLKNNKNNRKNQENEKIEKLNWISKKLNDSGHEKIRRVFGGLDQNKNLINQKNLEKNLKLKDFFKRLNASKGKLGECLSDLKDNAFDKKTKTQKQLDAAKMLINRLKNASLAKSGECVEKLKKNRTLYSDSKMKRENLIKKVMGWLKDSRRDLLQNPLNKLRSNNDQVNDLVNKKDREKLGLMFLQKQNQKNREIDARLALSRLRSNNVSCNAQLLRQTTAIRKLMAQGHKVRENGLAEAISRLKSTKDQSIATEKRKKELTLEMMKRLKESQSEKLRNALIKLRELNMREGLKQNLKKGDKKRAIQRLVICSKAKMSQVLSKLIDHKRKTKMTAESLKNRTENALQTLVDKLKESQHKALFKLKDNNIKSQLAKRKRDNLTSRLLNRLVSSSGKKQQLFLQKAHDLAFSKKSKQEIQNAKLKNIFGKLMKKKMLYCLEHLMINSLKLKITSLKKLNVFRHQKQTALCKNALTIGKMRLFSEVRKLKFNHNANLLNSLFNTLVKSRKSVAFGELRQNATKLSAKELAALKFIKKQLLNKARNAFDKLNGVNQLFKRNRINNAVSGMLFCLKKNHKASMRNMLDVWSQKEAKIKTKNFNNILNGLIHKRLASGFEKIKFNYNAWKHKKVLQGLMATLEKVDKIQATAKGKALKDMYDMFIDNNPWFKKCISILAMSSKLTDQVSFWKMRVVKNLKREGVNPMQAIKLNKMAQIIKKAELKNIGNAFWKIQQTSDINMSKLLGINHLGINNSTINHSGIHNSGVKNKK